MDILRKRLMRSFKSKSQMTFEQRKDFLILLADLLQNGFTLQESLTFIGKVLGIQKQAVAVLKRELKHGRPFYEGFKQLGFTDEQTAQIYFADIHGNLVDTLSTMGKQMTAMKKKKEDLIKVMIYPCILFSFLLLMLMLIKYLLLPQLEGVYQSEQQVHWSLIFIQQLPLILGIVALFIILIITLFRLFLKKCSAIQRATLKSKIPIYGFIYSHYITAFFATEWSKLLNQGLELKQIFTIMQHDGNTALMQEMAKVLQEGTRQGKPIYQQLKKWGFLAEGIPIILKQGEKKGKLGEELKVYGNKVWEQLMKKIENWLQWLQPMIFLFVALLIVSVYGALLLPLYEGMSKF